MDRNAEVQEKRRRVRAWLEREGLDGVLLSKQAHFAWYTAGGENRVVLAGEAGAASLLLTRERDVVLTDNIEAPRIEAEALAGLDGFGLEVVSWHDEGARAAKREALIGVGKLASDAGEPGTRPVGESFCELTYALTERETGRYRVLGRACSVALEQVLLSVSPGDTEHQVEAEMARRLLAQGIMPTVLLVAADERLDRFRHPLATDKKIKRVCMAVMCGRRGGLIANLTRIVHFGPVPDALAEKHRACCRVDAAYIDATREGRPVGEVLQAGIDAYAAAGFPDEWTLHHQGGPTGYQGRSYKATPGETRTVQAHQAFAWNPSIRGTKSEDTVLALPGGAPPEILTPAEQWPCIDVEWNGTTYRRPDILVK